MMQAPDGVIFSDGEDDAVLLPDWVSFGPDIEVVLTRVGDTITIRSVSDDDPKDR